MPSEMQAIGKGTYGSADRGNSWSATTELALRQLAAVTWAGGLLGFLIGGIGGRLAMMLLAKLNPEVAGLTSDDGFTMGQLTLESLDLLATTTLLGVLGGGLYFVLRGLMIGPRWFQILSISFGPAIVAGSVIVNVDGIDFTLDPVLLAVALFVAIPWAYAVTLTVIAERWLASGARFMTVSKWLAGLPLLLWLPIFALLGALLLGLLGFEAVRRTPRGRAVLAHPAVPWLAWLALAALFVMSLIGLVRDTIDLV